MQIIVAEPKTDRQIAIGRYGHQLWTGLFNLGFSYDSISVIQWANLPKFRMSPSVMAVIGTFSSFSNLLMHSDRSVGKKIVCNRSTQLEF
jgi:hypothetical protein